jgi:hypothetical protein
MLLDIFLFLQSPVEAAMFLAAEGKLTQDDVQRVKRSADEASNETPDWFQSMDANGNGFLEPKEIDNSQE